MTAEPRVQVTFQRGQTHRSLFRGPLVGDRTLQNRTINVGTEISGSSNFSTFRQTFDPNVKLSTTGNWKARNMKVTLAPQWESVRTRCFKGRFFIIPPHIFLFAYLMFLYIFKVFDLNLSISNPYPSE